MGKRPEGPRSKPLLMQDPEGLAAHLLRYLDRLTERNYSPWTVDRLHGHLRDFTVWCEGQGVTRPSGLDRPLLEAYQRYLFHYRKKNGQPLSGHDQEKETYSSTSSRSAAAITFSLGRGTG